MNARVLPLMPLALAALILQLIPSNALGQPWTPPRGEFLFSLGYQFLDDGDHLLADPVLLGIDFGSTKVDFGKTRSQVLVLDGEIGLTDRLAVSGAVAFVGSKYTVGGFGEAYGADTGEWEQAFQDGRIGARFQVLNSPTWAVTPSVSYGFPTTNYQTLGHSAIGRGLNELRLGVDVGRVLSFGDVPKAYLQGSFSYAFMEHPDVGHILVGDHHIEPLNRNNLFFEFGYFLPKFVTVQAFADYQNMRGGIDTRDFDHFHGGHSDGEQANFEEFFAVHDALLAEDFWRVGGGFSIPLAESVELNSNIATTVWGKNTHQALTVSLGVSWAFQLFGGIEKIGP